MVVDSVGAARKAVAPGYYNVKQAAAYLGYGVSTFRAYVERCAIPKCGPKRNRFRKADLDAFMADPLTFQTIEHARRRRRSGFTPVSV